MNTRTAFAPAAADPDRPPVSTALVCRHCGTAQSRENASKPGSGWIEALLWLWLIFPGAIYSVWRRRAGALPECLVCGRRELVPADSPVGQKLLKDCPPGRPVLARPAPTIDRHTSPAAWFGLALVVLLVLVLLAR